MSTEPSLNVGAAADDAGNGMVCGGIAVARLFCGVESWPGLMIRDHANIARAMAALGSVGVEAVNRVVIEEAVKVGFADPKVLSADTTVQELPIGYPHEAGILRVSPSGVSGRQSKWEKRW